ncbi:MAG: response regulator transcription factor [Candidatus Bipolaricaulota bacterium]|nr:response regulator transcription factor [Candidatus Bipolaricaulota bacterium]
MTTRILIVDDEEWVSTLVGRYLEQAGYDVATASDGEKALTKFESFRPDLIILDWMLPKVDGLEVARQVRTRSAIPIIMLTARADEMDRIEGLDGGADDYVVKPFSARELEVRIRAVLRRTRGETQQQMLLEAGDIRLDPARHEVKIAGRTVDLTPMEFDLLAFLLRHPGHVFTRLELLEAVRGTTYDSFARSIDSHVRRLREKIEPDPSSPRYVQTVFGIGYKLADDGGKQ